MSLLSYIAKATFQGPRIDTAAAINSGASILRIGQQKQRSARSQEELTSLYATNGWVRLACGVRARNRASARLTLLAPTSPKRGRAMALKGRVMVTPMRFRMDLIKEMREQGELVDVEEAYGPHPFLAMIRRGVPGYFDGFASIALDQILMDIVGEVFYLILRDKVTHIPVLRLPIPAHWVTPPSLGTGDNFYRIRFLSQPVPPEDIETTKEPSPFNPYGRGTGVASSLDHDIAIYEQAMIMMLARFLNKGRPDVLIAGSFGPREKEEVEARFEEKLRGAYAAGTSIFLSIPSEPHSKFEVHDLDRSAADLQAVELTKSAADVILKVFGVPPAVIGEVTANRATAYAAKVFLRENSTIPSLEASIRHLQQRYLEPHLGRPPEFAGEDRIILSYELEQLVDEERRDRIIDGYGEAFELNELRAAAGFPADERLDGLFSVPIGKTIEHIADVVAAEPKDEEPAEVEAKRVAGAWRDAMDMGLDVASKRWALKPAERSKVAALLP